MGVPGPKTTNLEDVEKRFSDDILKIELSGPDHRHLSSTKEINEGVTIEGRHQRERQFFSTSPPWTELNRDRVGVNALKSFLGHLLYDHIRSEFPAVVADIERLSLETQKELEILGPSRQTLAEQRRFLTRISSTYQNEVEKSLNGNYSADLEALSILKLRMHLRQYADDFAQAMATNGHAKVFRTIRDENDPEFRRPADDLDNIYDWIRRYYLESRGSELPGTVNPIVLQNMFRQQSSPWEKIAVKYLENISSAVHSYNEKVLAEILPDDDMREKLRRIISSREQETYSQAHEQLLKILNDERGGILQTVNHYYADNLSSIRQERVTTRLETLGLHDGMLFNMDRVLRGVHLSNEDQAIFDIHDILKAYYKVAMKRFTDNVVVQVSERYILGDGGQVKMFSPDMVGDFEDDKLTEIAGENFATASQRNDLVSKAARFKQALEIAKQAVL